MSFVSVEGIPRQYGGPAGYGHAGYRRRVLGVWEKLPGPARSAFDHLVARLGLATSPAPRDLRSAVLDPKGPGIFDQSSSSSCTGQATVGSTMTRLVVMGAPAPYKLSPFDAYAKGRLIDNPSAPLEDTGAIPEQVTRACSEIGICAYDLRPNDPTHVNDHPTFGQIEQGLRTVVRGIYGLRGDVEATTQIAVSAGFPVKLGALVDPPMEEWSGGDPIGPPDPARVLGGHAMYVCGWAPWSGGVEYILGNSWGTGYGEGGFVRVNGLWLRQASDFEITDVTALEAA
ncbi:MAG TPA: C1 family peptidase [Polyangiaceae bacterium]